MIASVQKAPRLTQHVAERIVSETYAIEGSATPLPSERDQNFLIKIQKPDREGGCNNEQFVLKIANSEESLEFLELQNEMMQFLGARQINLEFPRIVPTRIGENIASITDEGRGHFVRLLTWIDGVCFAEVQPHGSKLLASLGRALAQMDAALVEFSHPAARRDFYWDLRSAAEAQELVGLLPDHRRPLVEPFFAEWEKIEWSQLRFSVIHNDANDYNILVRGAAPSDRRVTAILDYGDVVHTATVCNLAVALAYVMLDKPNPISAAAQVVAAYHETYPLRESEIEVLYTLAISRLCCSVCYAAKQTRDVPDNEYLNISNAPAWALLEKLSTVPVEWPTRMFRYACGLPTVRKANSRSARTSKELISARGQHLGPSLSISYRQPIHIVSGAKQYLYAADGRQYLDCVNNVAHVGHSHPRVVRAASEQMAILNTNTRYLHEKIIEYSQRLTALLPDPLSVVYLVNSGSEANELALRLARAHTLHEDVIVVDSAYHGNTSAMVDLSPYKFDGPGGRGCPSWVHSVPMPDVYRGEYRGTASGARYAHHVADAAQVAAKGRGIASFFCESALSCGGQIILPRGYLKAAFAAVRAAGGVCVADEVQTGFGRAGERFWMFETQDVVPDIVTLGKPIGNGHPIGAVITTREIADSFDNGMEYFNTFGGNPVSCAVGLAVLDIIRDEELQQNAQAVGQYLLDGVRQLQQEHPLIGDVRGLGLFLGIEFVHDRGTLEPADASAAKIVELMKERGVLLSTDGPFHNVIKIKPPLVFSERDADFLLSNLKDVLEDWGNART